MLVALRRCGLVERLAAESLRVCMKGTSRGDSIRGAETWESRLLGVPVAATEREDLLRL